MTKTRPMNIAEQTEASKFAMPVKRSKLDYATLIAADLIRMAKDALEGFAKNLAENPHYAFSWGERGIEASARNNVGQTINVRIEMTKKNQPDWSDDRVADNVLREIENEMIRKARWPEHSTSAVSNLTSMYRTAALAEFVARMREFNAR